MAELNDPPTVKSFVSALVEDGIGAQAFMGSTFDGDFILLAEFCEMEGPKPIFTIPSVFNSTFNLNTFAVRIMSVDCVSIMQTTDFTNFKVAGDIQVILTEQSEGAVAYVHHFVLYDICARGFVRPYCLAYVMENHTELLSMYEKLCTMFSLVTSLFHFGNALSFISDLILRLEHLSHLKRVLNEKSYVIFVDEIALTESQKKSITSKALDDAMHQLHQLIRIFKSYVESEMFVDHRELFQDHYLETLKKLESNDLLHITDDLSDESVTQDIAELAMEETEEAINDRPSHNVPSDVISSILGKKYDKRLRNLNDLCDVTNDIALDVLRYSLHAFTHRDLSSFNPFVVALSKSEQACKLTIGSTEFPVLSCVTNKMECCTINTPAQVSSVSTFLQHFVDFQKQEQIADSKKKLSELITSETDGVCGNMENIKTSGFQFLGDLSSSFLSLLHYTSISLPIASTNDNTYSKLGSFVNIPSVVDGVLPVTSSLMVGSQNQSQSMVSEHSSSDSYKDALSYPESNASSARSSIGSSNNIGGGGTTFCHSVSVVSTETVNIPTSALGDDVKEIMKSSQISLLKLNDRFSYLPHIIYSFFIGRPVVVTGKETSAKSVSSVVYGLANMLPNNSVKPKRVCAKLSGKLTLKHLGVYGIIGILKHKDRNPVPISLRPYISVMDLDKDSLEAPFYQGKTLMRIFDPSRSFSEGSFRKFIKQSWAELIAESYVKFTNQYTHQLSSYTQASHPIALSCDQEIVKYFVDTLRMQIVHAYPDVDLEDVTTVHSIRLNNKKCQKIPNQFSKKKSGGKVK